MIKQIIFIIALAITLGVFFYTISRLYKFFGFTKPFALGTWGKRFRVMFKVAIFQSKIFRRPVIGFFHAMVFWGFCVILIGSIEMVIDGVSGSERVLSCLGVFYDIITASGDIFALIIIVAIIVFLVRRLVIKVKRFEGIEMKPKNHWDAAMALTMILILMISLLGMNTFYLTSCEFLKHDVHGTYPVSSFLAGWMGVGEEDYDFYQLFWWIHILLIFVFANILPYSKHFHIFLSVFNVLFVRLDPLGKLPNMPSITREVKMMLDPSLANAENSAEPAIERFGIKDVEDGTWKNYFDSLTCTQCGRCTSVCPANITGKKLSPRKVMMNYRARMKEKGPGMIKQGKEYDDKKSLINDDYLSLEELWACTTCNACAKECPLMINQPELIMGMRRYLVMEEGNAPAQLKTMFANIENNGAPWQFSPEDRMQWAEDLVLKG
ncbi:MAG TPA: (Fe-S)-binding protein [Bacteroidales bacterium]|nr:(Fe-S)-binding protein [Bacteroidales bacterium]HNZ43607.1 (Fe-S)-binding protein [Bacteroidales bacterium]HOH84263.1 (Fe-S)-binding protein [Bacteroidales bacterium]HPB26368.1 (Fe-S)-binding protein [Bacteroidales bacterium]HPI30957.1 (Fe-S)-binding protein [Bacteroidales bacterium]